jgi:hypothetical protein
MIMTRPNRPSEPTEELNVVQRDIQRLLRPQNISAQWDLN